MRTLNSGSGTTDETHALLGGALDALPAHVAVLDAGGRIVAANDAWDRFACQSGADGHATVALGTSYLHVCDAATGAEKEDARATAIGIRRLLAGEIEKFTYEYACYGPNEEFWYELRVTPIAGVGLGRALITHENITARVVAEHAVQESIAQLTRARGDAERASHAKTQFLSNVSHELRTPLNGVLGAVELLSSATLEEERREYLEIIETSSRTLVGIINNVLDVAKIEQGALTLETVPLSLRGVVASAVKGLNAIGRRSGVALTHRVDAEVGQTYLGDPLRIAQVLTNLVSNALKFTQTGTVSVSVTTAPGGALRFEVRDTGIGIDGASLERIFEPFTQADASTTRRFGGTGLGLPIAREIVRAMGGDLRVESELGRGSRFFFDVTLERVEGLASRAARGAVDVGANAHGTRRSSARVLLVEDNPVSALVARRILERGGYVVVCAVNGKEGLDAMAEHGFDAIVSDIQMPVMDGDEFIWTVRAQEQGTGLHLPIIMLTANAMGKDRDRIFDSGADEYMAKPLDAPEFLRMLERLLVQAGEHPVTAAIERPGS